jgi:hypothetical protein
VGCYALINSQWSLLFTDPDAETSWQRLFAAVK